MTDEFHRIKRLPPYVFSEVNRLKADARAAGADIIDLGMGNPDMPTPKHIIDKLVETVNKPRTNRYSASKGIPGLRRAQAAYYERRFGVKLDPETQVIATLGSKEGFANMAQAITAPGDIILVPNRPIRSTSSASSSPERPFAISRRQRAGVPARRREGGQVLDPQAAGDGAELPVEPDGHDDLDFYAEAVQLAKRLGLIILSDLATPRSISTTIRRPPLQVPGAIDIAVEFTSLSKTYSMPGWRVGFAVETSG